MPSWLGLPMPSWLGLALLVMVVPVAVVAPGPGTDSRAPTRAVPLDLFTEGRGLLSPKKACGSQGWVRLFDRFNKEYFFNTLTRTSQYTKPVLCGDISHMGLPRQCQGLECPESADFMAAGSECSVKTCVHSDDLGQGAGKEMTFCGGNGMCIECACQCSIGYTGQFCKTCDLVNGWQLDVVTNKCERVDAAVNARPPVNCLGKGHTGVKVKEKCECRLGFSVESSCAKCDSDHYGDTCTACSCRRGKCDDGNDGSGKCCCPDGWTGATCSRPVLDSAAAWLKSGGVGPLRWSVFDEVVQDVAERLTATDRKYAGCHKCFAKVVKDKKQKFKIARSDRMWCPDEEFCYEVSASGQTCPSSTKKGVMEKQMCGPKRPTDYLTVTTESNWIQDPLEVQAACTHCVARNVENSDTGLFLQYVWVPKLQTCLNGFITPNVDQLRPTEAKTDSKDSRAWCETTCKGKAGACMLKKTQATWNAICYTDDKKDLTMTAGDRTRCEDAAACDWAAPADEVEGDEPQPLGPLKADAVAGFLETSVSEGELTLPGLLDDKDAFVLKGEKPKLVTKISECVEDKPLPYPGVDLSLKVRGSDESPSCIPSAVGGVTGVCYNRAVPDEENCKCKGCVPPWGGDTCSECSLTDTSCENDGTVRTDACACNCPYPWGGKKCNLCMKNDDDCMHNGKVNRKPGSEGYCQCTSCEDGWTGSERCCSHDCNGRGKPNADCTRCTCDAGFAGDTCQLTIASEACSKIDCNGENGQLNLKTCSCKCGPGWTGEHCHLRACNKGPGFDMDCSGHGFCKQSVLTADESDTATGVCVCNDKFSGLQCDPIKPMGVCSLTMGAFVTTPSQQTYDLWTRDGEWVLHRMYLADAPAEQVNVVTNRVIGKRRLFVTSGVAIKTFGYAGLGQGTLLMTTHRQESDINSKSTKLKMFFKGVNENAEFEDITNFANGKINTDGKINADNGVVVTKPHDHGYKVTLPSGTVLYVTVWVGGPEQKPEPESVTKPAQDTVTENALQAGGATDAEMSTRREEDAVAETESELEKTDCDDMEPFQSMNVFVHAAHGKASLCGAFTGDAKELPSKMDFFVDFDDGSSLVNCEGSSLFSLLVNAVFCPPASATPPAQSPATTFLELLDDPKAEDLDPVSTAVAPAEKTPSEIAPWDKNGHAFGFKLHGTTSAGGWGQHTVNPYFLCAQQGMHIDQAADTCKPVCIAPTSGESEYCHACLATFCASGLKQSVSLAMGAMEDADEASLVFEGQTRIAAGARAPALSSPGQKARAFGYNYCGEMGCKCLIADHTCSGGEKIDASSKDAQQMEVSPLTVMRIIASGGSTVYGISGGSSGGLLYKIVDSGNKPGGAETAGKKKQSARKSQAKWTVVEGSTAISGDNLEVGGYGRSCSPGGRGCVLYTTFGGKVYSFEDTGNYDETARWRIVNHECKGCTSVFAGTMPVIYAAGKEGVMSFEDTRGNEAAVPSTVISTPALSVVVIGSKMHVVKASSPVVVQQFDLANPQTINKGSGSNVNIKALRKSDVATLKSGVDGYIYYKVVDQNKKSRVGRYSGGAVGKTVGPGVTNHDLFKELDDLVDFSLSSIVGYAIESSGSIRRKVMSSGTEYLCSALSATCPYHHRIHESVKQ